MVSKSITELIADAKQKKRFHVSASGTFVISFDTATEAIAHVVNQTSTIEDALKLRWTGKKDTRKFWKIVDSTTGQQVN